MNLIQQKQPNFYYIKSLARNQLFTIDKKEQPKFAETANQVLQEFYWQIISLDLTQSFDLNYQLNFGEFLEIQPINGKPLNKNPLLIQQSNLDIISSQTFQMLDDNLVKKQPCVLINVENNFYLTITSKITYQETPNQDSYFQIIPVFDEEKLLKIQRPILKFYQEFYIRNYKTGFYLNFVEKDNCSFVTAIRPTKNKEKWTLIQVPNCINGFLILNHSKQQYVDNSEELVKLTYSDQNDMYWDIQTIGNKEFALGVPFIIQNSQTRQYLTMNEINLKEPQNYEQQIYQSKYLLPNSLWIIFNYTI